METIQKLEKAKRSIEDAIEYIQRAKRATEDDTVKSKLRHSEGELDSALRAVKDAIRDLK
jgi:hypothetical protein